MAKFIAEIGDTMSSKPSYSDSLSLAGSLAPHLMGGNPNSWLVYFIENPKQKWMRSGGTPMDWKPPPRALTFEPGLHAAYLFICCVPRTCWSALHVWNPS